MVELIQYSVMQKLFHGGIKMGQKLKTYQIQLTVKGPVFIGDGNQIQKKEYVFLNRNTLELWML